jgi:hypothetical protein
VDLPVARQHVPARSRARTGGGADGLEHVFARAGLTLVVGGERLTLSWLATAANSLRHASVAEILSRGRHGLEVMTINLDTHLADDADHG